MAHLGMEAIATVGVVGQVRGEEFQRHRLSELQIIGSIDFAERAFAQQADDAVAFGDDCAGKKTPVIDRWGFVAAASRAAGEHRTTARHRRLGQPFGRRIDRTPAGRAEASVVGDGMSACRASQHRVLIIRQAAAGGVGAERGITRNRIGMCLPVHTARCGRATCLSGVGQLVRPQ